MKNQQGAALIVVLILLAVSLMLGLSSVQSSLIDEHMARNYRASTQAYMAAEVGIVISYDSDNRLIDTCSISGFESWKQVKSYDLRRGEYTACFKDEGNKTYLISEGGYGDDYKKARRVVAAIIGESSEASSSYLGMVTCEGGGFSGSGVFDSYDSRKGPYGLGSNLGDEAILMSLKEDSSIMMTAGNGGGVRGDIYTAGSINFTNTQKVSGNVYARGDVGFNNWGEIVNGNVVSERNVNFNTGAVVGGDVKANQSIYIKGGWGAGASIQGGAYSLDVKVPQSEAEDRVAGGIYKERQSFDFSRKVGSLTEDVNIRPYKNDCPGYGVTETFNSYMSVDDGDTSNNGDFSYNHGGKVLAIDDEELGLDYYKKENGVDVFKFSSFALNGKGIRVEKPTVLVIDGKVDLGSWGKVFIGDGAFLEIYTSGQFLSSGSAGIDVGNNGANVEFKNGLKPTFSVFSTYDDSSTSCDSNSWSSECGVAISGDADVYGRVVAPYSNVTLTGSGKVFGSINSRKLTIPGGTSIHQDIAYREVSEGGGQGGGAGRKFQSFGECVEENKVDCFNVEK